MKRFIVLFLLFLTILFAAHTQVGGNAPRFRFAMVNTPRDIRVLPNQTAMVHCQYNCTGIDWDNCSIEPNAIIIIPADNYSAHEICLPHARDKFRQEGFNITATCVESTVESIQQVVQNVSIATYNITLQGFNNSSLREFIIFCGAARYYSLDEGYIRYSGLLHRRTIVKVEEVKVNSYDIDRHPAKLVQQGHNVSITCAKTPGSISEWKLSIPKQFDSLEVLYVNSANFTKDANLCLEEGTVDEVTGMQNFSITLTDVHVNMSGTAIECGARQSGMSIAQTQFHHQAAILIVHREQGGCDEFPTHTPPNDTGPSTINAAQIGGISSGVVILSLLAATVVLIAIILGYVPIHHAVKKRQAHRKVTPLQ